MAGVEIVEFDPGSRRDEAMDTFIYAVGALRRSEVDYGKVMKRLEEEAKAAKEPRPDKEKEETAIAGSGRGWKL